MFRNWKMILHSASLRHPNFTYPPANLGSNAAGLCFCKRGFTHSALKTPSMQMKGLLQLTSHLTYLLVWEGKFTKIGVSVNLDFSTPRLASNLKHNGSWPSEICWTKWYLHNIIITITGWPIKIHWHSFNLTCSHDSDPSSFKWKSIATIQGFPLRYIICS